MAEARKRLPTRREALSGRSPIPPRPDSLARSERLARPGDRLIRRQARVVVQRRRHGAEIAVKVRVAIERGAAGWGGMKEAFTPRLTGAPVRRLSQPAGIWLTVTDRSIMS
jgi:hypothetical protein